MSVEGWTVVGLRSFTPEVDVEIMVEVVHQERRILCRWVVTLRFAETTFPELCIIKRLALMRKEKKNSTCDVRLNGLVTLRISLLS